LSLQYACSANAGEWAWRLRNPNSYDVSVVWGWEDQWPTQNSFPFVVPAAHSSKPGEWLITTARASWNTHVKDPLRRFYRHSTKPGVLQ